MRRGIGVYLSGLLPGVGAKWARRITAKASPRLKGVEGLVGPTLPIPPGEGLTPGGGLGRVDVRVYYVDIAAHRTGSPLHGANCS